MTTSNGFLLDAAWHGGFSPYPSREGLDELLAAQMRARPEAVAIDAGKESISYAELDRRANRLAHRLRELGVGEETPVGVFMGPRIEQIVAQIAICKSRGTYVPLDPEYPRERLEFMLADTKIPVVLTERRAVGLDLSSRQQICVDTEDPYFGQGEQPCPVVAGGAERRTHILYTSGSTGKPKGIEILARGVSRLVLATNYVKFEPSDRVAQLANFSFDAAIFEVWGALLNGATIVLIPRHVALDPHALQAELIERRVSVMFLTTALFNLVAQACPDAFQSLQYLVVGGEKLNALALRAVLAAAPPQHLVNGYGPTESTTFAVTCELNEALTATHMVPIGRPIANTLAFILDDVRRPVALGESGELYLGGDGLARGYLNQPELTAERFVSVPGLTGAAGAELRLYRTGDQARRRPDGLIEFLGRTDFQVKIRGFRIEFEEIEAALLASDMLIAAAVTVHEGTYGDNLLIAHIVPRDPQQFRPVSLQKHLQATLPYYMVPSRFLALEELPLNANGKVDRAELMSEQGRSGPFSQSPVSRRPGDMLALDLAQLWADILGVETVMRDDDFFSLGGTSLLAARLVLRVRDVYKVHYPIYALYESGTLRDFIAVVRRAQKGGASLPPGPDGPDTWQADARLPNDIRAAIVESVGRRRASGQAWWVEGAVFLTGATGFLGAFLLRDLLVTTGARVHCLVRAANEAEGMTRLREALTKYELWQDGFEARIHAVPGDLQRRRFGLDAAAFAALADAVDVVIHSGAQVSYVQPYVAHRATNVGGTAEVLRLAATGRLKPLHHVSTIAVFGPRGFFGGDHCVREDDDLDTNLESLSYDIGYSTSKWVSEKMAWEAEDAGLEVTVYRPGFIMGDSRTGAGNADDFVGRLVRGAIQIGAYPDLPRQSKEFVPVDYVSRSILHIARQADSHGRAYHLVPPDPRESIDLEQFFVLVCEFGYSLTRESYGEWVERVSQDSRERDNPLCPLVPMLSECVYRDEVTRWELYEGMTYDASNAARVLQDSEIRFHPMNQALIAKYVGYWIGTGDLPGEPKRIEPKDGIEFTVE